MGFRPKAKVVELVVLVFHRNAQEEKKIESTIGFSFNSV